MKTLLSQCLKKITIHERHLQSSTQMHRNKKSFASKFSLVRTITEARESPDRMLCSRNKNRQ